MDISDFTAILGLALVAVVGGVFLRESRLPTAALLLSAAAGCLVLLRLLPILSDLIEEFCAFGTLAAVDEAYFTILLKVIGFAYLGEFAAQLCRDAGANGAALRVELAAKLCILALAFPLVSKLAVSLLGLLA